jgi:invasion protein IalB
MLWAAQTTKKVTEMSIKICASSFALSLGLAFGLALAAPVLAQDTTATTAPVVADAPSAQGLAMGVEAGAPPAPKTQESAAIGETYLATTFDSWEQRCVKTEDGSDPCQLYQLLKDNAGNNVAEINLFPLPAGGQAAAGATIVVPLETLLTANLEMAVDANKPRLYPFTFCAQIGCIARIGLTAEEVDQFRKGAKATMTIVPAAAPDQKVELNISLKGYTAGYAAVEKTQAK